MIGGIKITTNDETILAIDIGGTNTRAGLAILRDAEILPHPAAPDVVRSRVRTKDELEAFIRSVTARLPSDETVSRSVVDIAGVVIERREARIANWTDAPVVDIQELSDWGLPAGRTLMVNDMVAAGFGVLGLEESEAIPSSECTLLFDPPGREKGAVQRQNKILLAPGTGLGTLGIVSVNIGQDTWHEEPISSEIQHFALSPLDDGHARLIASMLEDGSLSEWPRWEDFVSGTGLVRSYEALIKEQPEAQRMSVTPASGGDLAAAIAEHGAAGTDPVSVAVMDLYYRCAGRVAQMMALMYHPYGGIFFCGDSTRMNASFIRESRFVAEIHNNLRHRSLLESFPVYLVSQELQVAGGLWGCKNRVASGLQ